MWFYFSQFVFEKALPFRKEVAIGPLRVIWLEYNADFVTLTDCGSVANASMSAV